MDKFKKFLRKPLFVLSIVLSLIFLFATIVMVCIPHGRTYYCSYEIDDIEYEYEITLGKTFKVRHEFFDGGVAYDVGDFSKEEYEYDVYNGKLSLLDSSTSAKQELGKITSTKIILNYGVDNESETTVLVCKVNDVLTKTFASLFCLSVVLLIVAISIKSKDFVDKKNKKTVKKEEVSEEPKEIAETKETTEPVAEK